MAVAGAGGGVSHIAAGGESYFLKKMIAGGAIASGRPVAKQSAGFIVEADSDDVNAMSFVGYAQEAAAGFGSEIMVMLAGANLAGAVVGLGFVPGEDIYLSENGGYTNNANSFTGNNDMLMRVGIADCAANEASATAVDLIAFPAKLLDAP